MLTLIYRILTIISILVKEELLRKDRRKKSLIYIFDFRKIIIILFCNLLLYLSQNSLYSANIDLWKESFETSIWSFFGVLSDVVHVLILVTFLTQQEVGTFFIAYAFLYLLAQIPRGFGIAIRKRASEIDNGRSKYLWTGFVLILPLLFLLYIVLWYFMPIIDAYSDIQISSSIVIALILATTGFSTLELARYYIAGCGNPGRAEKLRTGIGKTSMPVITVIMLAVTPSVESALMAVFISYFTTSIVLFAVSPHEFVIPSKDTIIDIINFSKWSLLTSILNDFYRRWDPILLGIMVSSIAVSYYDSSLRIAFLAVTFAVGISKTSNVKMSGMRELDKDITNVINKTIIASTVLTFPFLIITIFSGPYLLEILYGSEYRSAYIYLPLLVFVQLFQSYRHQFESVFNSIDNPEVTTKASLYTVIVNVITAPILVFYFGPLGVLYSTILSEILRLVIYQKKLKTVFGHYITPNGALLQYISFIIICIVIYLISKTVEINELGLLIISVILAFFGFHLLQYVISKQTREIVSEINNQIIKQRF